MNLKIGNRKTATGKVTVFDGFRHVSLWISRRLSSGERFLAPLCLRRGRCPHRPLAPLCLRRGRCPHRPLAPLCLRRGRCPHRPALGSPCKGGESRALPVADEARRTSGSGQNFSGFNAAAKFWAPQQVMSSVSETERLTGLRQSFRGADRVVRPYKITGHRCPHFPVSAHR